MKKNILGIFALFGAVVVPAAGVSAATNNPLDYAKSIGQVSESDTVNRVVEATSDGGYVVGGQILRCYRYLADYYTAMPIVDSYGDDDNVDAGAGAPELVSLNDCLSSQDQLPSLAGMGRTTIGTASSATSRIMVSSDPCVGTTVKSFSDSDEEYEYDLICTGYIAKFKKDGTREWITTIEEEDRTILAVGETEHDYHLLAQSGMIYVFSKSGDINGAIPLGVDYVWSAEFDTDGSLYVFSNGNIIKYDKDGSEVARLSGESDQTHYLDYYSVSNSIIMNGDIYAMRSFNEYSSGRYERTIMKVSKDLSSAVELLDSGDENGERMLFSGDKEGNILTVYCDYPTTRSLSDDDEDNDNDDCGCKLEIYDKDGVLISDREIDYGLIMSDDFAFFDDFTFYDYGSNKITKYNKNLEVVFEHTLAEGETLNDFVLLNDGSAVGVGRSTKSNSNYNVDGDQNGIQLRFDLTVLDTDDPVDGGTTNPATADSIRLFAIMGMTAMGAAIIGAKKMAARR